MVWHMRCKFLSLTESRRSLLVWHMRCKCLSLTESCKSKTLIGCKCVSHNPENRSWYDTWGANFCHSQNPKRSLMVWHMRCKMSVTHKIQKIAHGMSVWHMGCKCLSQNPENPSCMTQEVQISVTHRIQKIPHGMSITVWHIGCKCVSHNPENRSWYDTWGAQMSVTHKIQKIPHGMTHEVQMSVTHKIQKIPVGMSVCHMGCKCLPHSQNPEDPTWYDTGGVIMSVTLT